MPTPFPALQFQDSDGKPVAFGTLVLRLTQDAYTPNGSQLCAGNPVRLSLDGTGTVVSGYTVWANSDLTPSDTEYVASVYSSAGQLELSLLFITIQNAGLVLLDTITTLPYTVSVANGSIIVSSGGSSGVSSVVFIDGSSTWSMEIVSGSLVVISGGSGGVPSVALTDTVTGHVWHLSVSGGSLVLS